MGGRATPLAVGKHRLTAAAVRNARKLGMLHDGGGLYLQITEGAEPDTPRKSWLLRYQSPLGRRREMGLGSAETVTLATARDLAEAAKALAGRGVDPIEQRKADRAAAALEAARAMTFREAAEAYMKAHAHDWRNEKHRAQWTATLDAYAYPVLGPLPVAAIDVALVLRVVEPIWLTKRETASRVRGRIEAILDWCAVRGYRHGDNPARWRGHLQKALPKRPKAVKHHAALPLADLGAFMASLREVRGTAALALEFCILTATRTNETLGARWAEIDLDAAVWTIPAERMKANREHRVPLSRQAVALLRKVEPLATPRTRYVFPGADRKSPLSGMSMLMTLRRMKRPDGKPYAESVTVHGFRSVFRDWAADATRFPREVAEAALAHTLRDQTEAAYRRGDALAKRRQLMQAWADFADRRVTGAEVIEMQGKRKAEQ